jgi:hypothetical protein
MSAITIEAALRDEQLLGAALGATETWATWLATLKAAFGASLNRAEHHAFAAVAGNRKPPQRKVQELWTIAGRGSGKSRIAAAIAAYIACFQEHDLDRGEIGCVLVLAGSRDQAGMVFSYAEAFLRRSPILRKMIKSVTAYEIRLTNGVVIAVHHEVSIWRDDTSANPDLEVYRAVRPSLARTGGMLVGISTPYLRTGLLHAKFRDYFDTDDDAVLVVRGATGLFNPTIDRATI